VRPMRTLVAVAVTLGLGGLAIAARDEPVPVTETTFTVLGAQSMPFVPQGSFITSTWFCPGVPSGQEGTGGSVRIVNPSDESLVGSISAYTTTAGAPSVSRQVSVEPRSTLDLDLTELQPTGSFVSAIVEIEGGGGFVEQQALHPAGDAVAACANAASSSWYFADGFTADGSTEQIVLTNPYPDAAIVDIGFVTPDGPRNPSRLQGYPVPGRSVQVVELGARDETIVAASIQATRGRVVAGRAQHYLGSGRLGFTMSLGAPSLWSQYWFADGERAEGVAETYSIFNPSDDEITVSAVFLGLPASDTFTNDSEIVVPARGVAVLDTADIAGLPQGRHGVVVSNDTGSSMLVERVITRPAGEFVATTVVMGAPSVTMSQRWSAAFGSEQPLENVIVVLNTAGRDATVTVSTLGTGGLVPVPGLESLPLVAGGVLTIPVTDPSALGVPFVVESTEVVFVERLLSRGQDRRGRSGSFLLAG
jgi:hypothetical protein